MANKERMVCLCGSQILRAAVHTHDRKIHVGYYCPACSQGYNIDMIPIVPVTAIIKLDHTLEGYPDQREMYIRIISAFSADSTVPPPANTDNKDIISNTREKMHKVLSGYCRPSGDKIRSQMIRDLNDLTDPVEPAKEE